MPALPRWVLSFALFLLLLHALPCQAGNNAGGVAFLSWDRAGRDTVLCKVPVTPFPLYLHLANAPDVRALAAKVDWTTRTTDSPPCYNIVSSAAPESPGPPDSLHGWAFELDPERDFNGDSTYPWTIGFKPEDGTRRCVQYRISGAACDDTARAEFVIAHVMTMDALGRIDTLAIEGGARIVPTIVALALHDVSPFEVPARLPADLAVRGRGLAPGTRVFLQRGGQRVEAESVALLDSTQLIARIESPFDAGDLLDVVVTQPAGLEATLWSTVRTAASAASPQSTYPHPTNHDFAFTQVALRGPTREQNAALLDPITHPEWPSWLDDEGLFVLRSPGDTAAIIGSYAHNGLGFQVAAAGGTPSWARFNLNPRPYATSLATLVTGGRVYKDASGQWADAGKPLLRFVVTYEDGDTTLGAIVVGTHARNWTSGQNSCSGRHYFFDVKPTDPLVAEILKGSSYFYDLQEIPLPAEKWSKRLASIEFTAEALFRNSNCPDFFGTSALCGLAVWPEFKVSNSQGDTLTRQKQGTNKNHGGYLFGSTAVGTRRTTNYTACQVASMAMCYTYAGFPCTVDSLNAHLQRNRGYKPSIVAKVRAVSVTGDTIWYSPYQDPEAQATLKVTDRFLVERGTYSNPLATFEVVSLGTAVRFGERHNPTTPVEVGDVGRVYWKMFPRVADKYTSNPRLDSADLPLSPRLASEVESLLVRNIPVQLNLATHGHFVVADGWMPAFRPDATARGTYSIKDPAKRDYTRLIQNQLLPINGRDSILDYRNEFRLARYVVPRGGVQPLAAGTATVVADGVASLSILLDGTRRVEVVDPLGRRMLRDAGSGEDLHEIPGAWIEDVGSGHDLDEDMDPSQTGYSLEVAEAMDGHYTLHVYARNGYALNAAAYDETGAFSTADFGDTTAGPNGSAFDIHYAAANRSVTVTPIGTLAVEPRISLPGRVLLAVRHNPSTGPVEFWVERGEDAGDAIEVFDTSGRRIEVVAIAAGQRTVRWDWRQAGCRPGVYLARLRSGSRTLRFAVLR